MAYKATGRPVGRPKTKEYVTLLARVPADLAALVKRYAGQHGQSVAELIREGVEWRIGDGDPRGMGLYLEESTDTREKQYYANTEKALEAESGAVLADMRTVLARQEAQMQALTQILEQQTAHLRSNVYSSNTSIGRGKSGSMVKRTPAAEDTRKSVDVSGRWCERTFTFDPAKHQWGDLCHKQHDRDGGQSVREQANNECVDCRWERRTAYKARQSAAKHASCKSPAHHA